MKPSEQVSAELRIVAGSLRGRRLPTKVHAGLRPTPQRVRESLFSILGNAVPGRVFVDLFAGTGVVGLEAVSRGASRAVLIESDRRNAAAIEAAAAEFQVSDRVQVLAADVYRWAERWLPPPEPVTIFISPPFPDLAPPRLAGFLAMVEAVRGKLPPDSVLVIQAEDGFPLNDLAECEAWDIRKYGRNLLLFWVAPIAEAPPGSS